MRKLLGYFLLILPIIVIFIGMTILFGGYNMLYWFVGPLAVSLVITGCVVLGDHLIATSKDRK